MRLVLAILALAASPPAVAQDVVASISIAPSEVVTARVADGSSGFVVLAREARAGETIDTVPAATDTLRFTFSQEGDQRLLHVENGYRRSFNYRARMFRGSRSAPTSVCTVLAGISAFESWPHPIDRLELSGPSLSDAAAATISCQ